MPSGKLKGKSPEERRKQWLTHFRYLLGTPDKNRPNKNIPLIFKDTIIIEDGVCAIEELREEKIVEIWEGTRRGWHNARAAKVIRD